MAKIAVEFKPKAALGNGRALGAPARRLLACGDGWSVSDVVCAAGPHDRPFEEQFSEVCIAIVTAGSFQYRSAPGRELMTPGSILLGSPGQFFECGHEHGVGDRCISFSYEQRYFEGLLEEAGVRAQSARFATLRVPPVRELSAQDAENRFQAVFRAFLGVFARKEHPLVLFLDDLQWLDAATLEFLRQLIGAALGAGEYQKGTLLLAQHP